MTMITRHNNAPDEATFMGVDIEAHRNCAVQMEFLSGDVLTATWNGAFNIYGELTFVSVDTGKHRVVGIDNLRGFAKLTDWTETETTV